jgi:hypothetical protein
LGIVGREAMKKRGTGVARSWLLRQLFVLTGAIGLSGTAASATSKTTLDERIVLESRVQVVRETLQAGTDRGESVHPLIAQWGNWNNWNNWNNWRNGWNNWGNWLNR